MKQLIAIVALLVTTSAYAVNDGGKHGNHGQAGMGPAGGQAAAGQASNSSTSGAFGGVAGAGQAGGNGGSYSFADNYQPWPQSEMKQFAKPAFIPYNGN